MHMQYVQIYKNTQAGGGNRTVSTIRDSAGTPAGSTTLASSQRHFTDHRTISGTTNYVWFLV